MSGALPERDAAMEELASDARGAIAQHWLHRASAERGVALAFELLRPRLRGVGAAAPVLALVDKAIDDERRHGDLCVELARRYGDDTSLEAPPTRGTNGDGRVPLPDFGTNDERLEVALLIVGTCCINESIASEWIRSCWQVATAPTAIFANREHLKDEIDHARLGWAHLASSAVTPEMKQTLASSWIAKLITANVAQWNLPDPHLPASGIPAHGHLSHADNLEVIDAAVRDVVLPGFLHVGIGGAHRVA